MDIFDPVNFIDKVSHLELPVIHSIIVKNFFITNQIPKSAYKENKHFKILAERLENIESESSNQTTTVISLYDIESMFESLIDADTKKHQGVVYTPHYIIDYLISESLKMTHKQLGEIVICDPACGSGSFLVRAASILEDKGVDALRSIGKQIIGFDINKQAVEFAISHVLLYLLKNGYDVNEINPNIFALDTLIENPESLWERVGRGEGFDIVCTNPPYVKLQNLSPQYRTELSDIYPDFTTGNYSLAMLFFISCHRMINTKGVAALITQNNLFTSNSAKSVRKYAVENKCIKRILDFSDHLIFEGILAYTCLLFLDRDKSKLFVEYKDMYKGFDKDSLPVTGFTNIEYHNLKSGKWRLAEEPHISNITKIEKTGLSLGKLCDIKVGYATLRDKVFRSKFKEGRWFARSPEGNDVEIESNIIKPAIKITESSTAEDLMKNDNGIIFPYFRDGEIYKLIPESDLKLNTPLTFQHLKSWRNELAMRDGGNKKKQQKYGAWYAWGRKQGMDSKGPKLLTKTFDSSPNFRIDKSDSLFSNGYAIMQPRIMPGGSKISIVALEKILNSRFMHYYAKLTSFQISGDFQCYQKNFIESFGIPIMSNHEYEFIEKCSDLQLEELLSKYYNIEITHIDNYFDY